MEGFCSDKARKARKCFLVPKTRELLRVPLHEQDTTYVGCEQLAGEECLKPYKEETVNKNAVLAAAKDIGGREEKRASCKLVHPTPKQRVHE